MIYVNALELRECRRTRSAVGRNLLVSRGSAGASPYLGTRISDHDPLLGI
jgi:hypothetical protein